MVAEYKERYDIDSRVGLAQHIPCETPLSLFIEPTNLCNFGCHFCPTGDAKLLSGVKKRTHLSLGLLTKILSDVKTFPSRIRKLHLNKDGEPLLNPDFPTMVEMCRDSASFDRIETITNASLLNDQNIYRLANCGLDVLKISIYGISSEEYSSSVRRKIDFNYMVHTIKSLFDLTRSSGTKIYIKMMESSARVSNDLFINTFGDIADRIFLERKVENWPLFNSGSGTSNLNVYQKEIRSKKNVCTLPFYSLVVNATGTVSACCVDWRNELVMGDVKTSCLREIWSSEAFNAFRYKMLTGERATMGSCSTCRHPEEVQPDDLDSDAANLSRFFKTI
jgi:radical SAM protein with 4Fe4S-binding SPASM domain